MDNHGLRRLLHTWNGDGSDHGLLEENPSATEEEIRIGLEGNLCRCTGYHNIVQAVMSHARSRDPPQSPFTRDRVTNVQPNDRVTSAQGDFQ